MTYRETCEYLFTQTPQFTQTGAAAYKPGLMTTCALDEHLGHPHRRYKTIHVGGTNGKGSTAHTLAAILQSAGYRVGLFTSPHLVDFRERMRVNGQMVSEDFVIEFVERNREFFEPLAPSFFELTTAMALAWFAEMQVDVAVIEVGLGGRLDCTNIITPEVSVVTNISLDHTDLLGHSLTEIAREKAGIMKPGVPFVLGECTPETLSVFQEQARQVGCPLILAEEQDSMIRAAYGEFPQGELQGDCQSNNMRTILTVVQQLAGWKITPAHVREGINNVCKLTGLRGRWEKLASSPQTLCDVGHNPGAWQYLGPRLTMMSEEHPLHVVFGMAADKDVDTVLGMLPKQAQYYWTQAQSRRALEAEHLAEKGRQHGLNGQAYPTVGLAYQAACESAKDDETIFIGGSCFVVADLLSMLQ